MSKPQNSPYQTFKNELKTYTILYPTPIQYFRHPKPSWRLESERLTGSRDVAFPYGFRVNPAGSRTGAVSIRFWPGFRAFSGREKVSERLCWYVRTNSWFCHDVIQKDTRLVKRRVTVDDFAAWNQLAA